MNPSDILILLGSMALLLFIGGFIGWHLRERRARRAVLRLMVAIHTSPQAAGSSLPDDFFRPTVRRN